MKQLTVILLFTFVLGILAPVAQAAPFKAVPIHKKHHRHHHRQRHHHHHHREVIR